MMTRVMKYLAKFAAICTLLLVAAACDVHQFPGMDALDPTLINTKLRLIPSQAMSAYYPEDTDNSSITSVFGKGADLKARYLLEVYVDESFDHTRVYADTIVVRPEDTDKIIERELELHALHYKVLVWQDLTNGSDPQADLWYSVPQLTAVKVWEASMYVGMEDSKLAQTTNESFDLSQFAGKWNIDTVIDIPLLRPQAKFVLITSDLAKFIATHGPEATFEKCHVKISYNGFMPTGYNVNTGLLNDSKGGYSFEGKIAKLNDKEAIIAFDYVLVGPAATSVDVKIEIFDEAGELLNSTNTVKIPLERNKYTIIRKEFLTKEYGGGVGIDSDFDGEYNIYV